MIIYISVFVLRICTYKCICVYVYDVYDVYDVYVYVYDVMIIYISVER